MRSPVLTAGDGALGFWKAVREVFPQARAQRCWFRKIANVLGALPGSAHPGAEKALAEIWNAEDKDHARSAVQAFDAACGAKFPRAVAKITGEEDELLAFCDYPAGRWVHLRTTSPIGSALATVGLRTKVTKGHGSKAAALAMAFKLIQSAQRRWRMVNAPHLVALVRSGAVLVNGKLVERPGDRSPEVSSPPAALEEEAAEAA
jgi:transposase-like protein